MFGQTSDAGPDLCIEDFDDDSKGFDRTTIIHIADARGPGACIRMDWCNFSSSETKIHLLLVSRTNKLFFGTRFFWGVIDLNTRKPERRERCSATFWCFEKRPDVIVVIMEAEAVACTLGGKTIDSIPLDPPFEYKFRDDGMEFNCDIFGKQILKLER